MNSSFQSTLELLFKKIAAYYPEADLRMIQKAYHFSAKAHEGQKRSSGDPYFIHPLEVALILAELNLDLASIVTGFLHDTVEDTGVTLEVIEKEFSREVANLVDGVTKLSKIHFKTSQEKQAENFRKMILAMSKDIRVILVKLADRLNNMRTLEFLTETKRRGIAQETLDIYAPIANRLGISWIKTELEDTCFRHLHPETYHKIAQKIDKSKNEQEKYIQEVTSIFLEKLKESEVPCTINGRAKHFYSIFQKMEHRRVDYEEVYDIIAFRIIVESISDCYKTLGIIHSAYKPVPGRFKDYVAIPKANAYQSLHTTVIGPKGERVEIQIRTKEMHQTAERGIAAHWKYKEQKFFPNERENVQWVHRLLEWQKDLLDPHEFLETVKIDLFVDDVFIFTPKGEVKKLSFGATPLDFAFEVHTDIGLHCVGAKVNGKIVPLKHRLKSGDQVEILTAPQQIPSNDWLKIVRSSRAKTKIRAFIREQEKTKAHQRGCELLEKALRSYHLSRVKLEKSGQLAKVGLEYGAKTIDELYILCGYGKITAATIVKRLIPEETHSAHPPQFQSTASGLSPTHLKNFHKIKKEGTEESVQVENLTQILTKFAKCCNPLPGDLISGFITRGKGVTIHHHQCIKLSHLNQDRKVKVHWIVHEPGVFKRHVKIKIISRDEPGILTLISEQLHKAGATVVGANMKATPDKKMISHFDLEISNSEQLSHVLTLLSNKAWVIFVERVVS